MKSDWIIPALVSAMAVGTVMLARMGTIDDASAEQSSSEYKVLPPIKHGNLSVYPVVAGSSHDTKEFITLDEGLKSGEVVVSEYGNLKTMVRRPGARPQTSFPSDGAQVNTLVLLNDSKRPLILLAGEIVMGGKQDRIIARDRVVAPESDPIDLSVFCVEPERWVQEKVNFAGGGGMVAPTVRARAMNDKNQQQVWAAVRSAAYRGVPWAVFGATRTPAPPPTQPAPTRAPWPCRLSQRKWTPLPLPSRKVIAA